MLTSFRTDHKSIRLDPEARNIRHTYVKPSQDGKTWQVQQMVIDPDEQNDWVVELEVDLAASRQSGTPAITIVKFGCL